MDTAYISALSALAGSAIGSLSSFATTWVSQNTQYARQRAEADRGRREALYGEFIDEASALYADAFVHEMTEIKSMVRLYSLISRMRLFSHPDIVVQAEGVVDRLVITYRSPNRSLAELNRDDFERIDPLRAFSERCRDELAALGGR